MGQSESSHDQTGSDPQGSADSSEGGAASSTLDSTDETTQANQSSNPPPPATKPDDGKKGPRVVRPRRRALPAASRQDPALAIPSEAASAATAAEQTDDESDDQNEPPPPVEQGVSSNDAPPPTVGEDEEPTVVRKPNGPPAATGNPSRTGDASATDHVSDGRNPAPTLDHQPSFESIESSIFTRKIAMLYPEELLWLYLTERPSKVAHLDEERDKQKLQVYRDARHIAVCELFGRGLVPQERLHDLTEDDHLAFLDACPDLIRDFPERTDALTTGRGLSQEYLKKFGEDRRRVEDARMTPTNAAPPPPPAPAPAAAAPPPPPAPAPAAAAPPPPPEPAPAAAAPPPPPAPAPTPPTAPMEATPSSKDGPPVTTRRTNDGKPHSGGKPPQRRPDRKGRFIVLAVIGAIAALALLLLDPLKWSEEKKVATPIAKAECTKAPAPGKGFSFLAQSESESNWDCRGPNAFIKNVVTENGSRMVELCGCKQR